MQEELGWIKLHRSIIDWEWYQEPLTFGVFLTCLLLANFEDKKWRGIVVKRGSFVTSLQHLSEKSHVSPQSVRTALVRLKSTSELTIKTTNKYTYISINNYNKYQQSTSESTNNQQTTNKQLTTTKERKEEEERENTTKPLRGSFSLKEEVHQAFMQDLARKYSVPEDFIAKTFHALELHVASKPSYMEGRGWPETLESWVFRDLDGYKKNHAPKKHVDSEEDYFIKHVLKII